MKDEFFFNILQFYTLFLHKFMRCNDFRIGNSSNHARSSLTNPQSTILTISSDIWPKAIGNLLFLELDSSKMRKFCDKAPNTLGDDINYKKKKICNQIEKINGFQN